MTYYPYIQQDADYRNAAWDLGCTCPLLPAHVHRPACPLFETPQQMSERLEAEYGEDYAKDFATDSEFNRIVRRDEVEGEIDAENRAIRGIEGKFR